MDRSIQSVLKTVKKSYIAFLNFFFPYCYPNNHTIKLMFFTCVKLMSYLKTLLFFSFLETKKKHKRFMNRGFRRYKGKRAPLQVVVLRRRQHILQNSSSAAEADPHNILSLKKKKKLGLFELARPLP